MERQLWTAILEVLKSVEKPKFNPHLTHAPFVIVRVWLWSVIHDRPVSWACRCQNWPPHERKQQLPSNSTMSRRLRSSDVRQLLEQVEERVLRGDNSDNLVWFIDGKPLAIGGCSKDRQAGYGRAANCKAKGYKLHSITGSNGSISNWRIAPMNKDERVMAQRLLNATDIQGYVVADGNYDSNNLHAICDRKGNLQLISRRRYGKHRGHGHRQQTSGRMRSKEILENPDPKFGEGLLKQRDEIERHFGNLTNWGGGLTHLPPWCRTHRRVYRWVQAKLILNQLKRRDKITTYAA